ncbi:hypothetical protein [Campylobacter lari]|uniref:hypothetical protein n=1 Tax=Campylobacter lari TaxID=201 RepID=UPI00057D2FB5|nr:hypothetical protein [Campylobacter lari]AJD05850.1 hypothetical protein (LicD domain) [Campylobacter lari RM16712]MCR6510605.1 hypothetical protein [Campylobacter lari]MCR6556772.1 hypothetical protein [Campylobacter lari]
MTFKVGLQKALRDSKGLFFTQKILAFYIVLLIQKKTNHIRLLTFFKICIFIRQKIVYYYQAEFDFYHREYSKALKHIDCFLKFYPKNIEAKYLKAQILFLYDKKQEAWEILIDCLNQVKRLKTWLFLSKMVESQNDVDKLEKLYLKYKQSYSQKEQVVINKYLITAFKKNYNYVRAKEYIKRNTMQHSLEVMNKKSKMVKQDAINALRDIKIIFDNIGVDFFLVSGTFLGCIREGNFLGHDYDIDIGIWSEDYDDEIKNKILEYGVFIQYDLNWVGGLKLKHINGVKIDVFLHFKEHDKIYHQGEVARWYNTTLQLRKYNFMGDEYYGFKDFDRYLSENYGNWKIKKVDFDNILDTPNAVIVNNNAFVIHLYQLMMSQYVKNNKSKILSYLEQFEEKI